MPFYSFGFVLALACVGLFYRAGQDEADAGLLWGGASLVVSMTILVRWNGGIVAVALGQLGVLAAITAYRLWRDPN